MAAHVLSVVRPNYPGVSLQRLEAGVSSNTNQEKADELRLSSQETAVKIIALDLYGEAGESSQKSVM